MMSVKGIVVGAEEVQAKLNKITSQAKKLIGHAVFKGVTDVESEAKKSIQMGGKSGIVYSRYNPKRKHRASAPGEPPASDTGFLVNNIKRHMSGDNLEGEVRSRADYSKFLEFGTSKMLPRPFMFPALEKNRGKIKQRIEKAVQVANRRNTK
jgi:HK97 gp10 family phage protein